MELISTLPRKLAEVFYGVKTAEPPEKVIIPKEELPRETKPETVVDLFQYVTELREYILSTRSVLENGVFLIFLSVFVIFLMRSIYALWADKKMDLDDIKGKVTKTRKTLEHYLIALWTLKDIRNITEPTVLVKGKEKRKRMILKQAKSNTLPSTRTNNNEEEDTGNENIQENNSPVLYLSKQGLNMFGTNGKKNSAKTDSSIATGTTLKRAKKHIPKAVKNARRKPKSPNPILPPTKKKTVLSAHLDVLNTNTPSGCNKPNDNDTQEQRKDNELETNSDLKHSTIVENDRESHDGGDSSSSPVENEAKTMNKEVKNDVSELNKKENEKVNNGTDDVDQCEQREDLVSPEDIIDNDCSRVVEEFDSQSENGFQTTPDINPYLKKDKNHIPQDKSINEIKSPATSKMMAQQRRENRTTFSRIGEKTLKNIFNYSETEVRREKSKNIPSYISKRPSASGSSSKQLITKRNYKDSTVDNNSNVSETSSQNEFYEDGRIPRKGIFYERRRFLAHKRLSSEKHN